MKDVELIFWTDSQDVYALQNINLEITEGSFLCVLVPRGVEKPLCCA